jgi:phosphoribosylformylglycinamidine synthase
MSFHNGKGCNVTIPGEHRIEKLLFSESGGFVLEVAPDNIEALRKIFSSRGIDIKEIGKTTTESILKINNVVDLPVATGKDAWESGLRDKLG